MLIREFLSWAEQAGAGERADAAGALAKAFLYADLDPIDTGDAGRALTLLLDDPSPLVRRALAEAFATASDAPHHILATLAGDRSDIAAIVIERSQLLSDAELIDAVAIGDDIAQCAAARRPQISAALAGALAEVGSAPACVILSRNGGADLSDFAVRRMLDRFGGHGVLREALCRRNDLSPEMRHTLLVMTAEVLSRFAVGCRWMAGERAERVVGEARDRGTVSIASNEIEQRDFVTYLRAGGYLTPALVLRALLSGNLSFVEAVLCGLSGKAAPRVAGVVRNPGGLGFTALYKATGLPTDLMPAFQAGLRAAGEPGSPASSRLDRRLVECVIAACATQRRSDVEQLTALLRRFEAEAARDEARAGLERMRSEERDARISAEHRPIAMRLPAIRAAA